MKINTIRFDIPVEVDSNKIDEFKEEISDMFASFVEDVSFKNISSLSDIKKELIGYCDNANNFNLEEIEKEAMLELVELKDVIEVLEKFLINGMRMKCL